MQLPFEKISKNLSGPCFAVVFRHDSLRLINRSPLVNDLTRGFRGTAAGASPACRHETSRGGRRRIITLPRCWAPIYAQNRHAHLLPQQVPTGAFLQLRETRTQQPARRETHQGVPKRLASARDQHASAITVKRRRPPSSRLPMHRSEILRQRHGRAPGDRLSARRFAEA